MPSYDKEGFLIVNETHSCEHFEPVPGRLFCMQECWYCKWADFHLKDAEDGSENSICRYHRRPES